ncbi:MAG TPA: tail fiber protein [Rhodothermales bacterium]|nr:tail fiber protein [Rhodothermales bacterium]
MSVLSKARRVFAGRPDAPDADATRRGFFRRLGGVSLAAVAGGGLLASREAQAAELRARLSSLPPGTYVDRLGRPTTPVLPSEAYLGEIWLFAGNFAPRGSAFCQGQILSIAQNTALFQLLGTTYGGNGQTTFALPDLRSRLATHAGTGTGLSTYTLGETVGAEAATLTDAQMPTHNHTAALRVSSGTGATPVPVGGYPAAPASSIPAFVGAGPTGTLASGATAVAGGGQSFPVIQPILGLNFCISLEGIYPSQ